MITVKVILFLVGLASTFFTGYFLAATKFRKQPLDTVGFYNWLSVSIIYIFVIALLGVVL